MSAPILSRRDWLKLSAAGVLGSCMSGWFEGLASGAAAHPARKKSCILLWMSGGPSTIDLWDLKPGHANGGTFKPIATSAKGVAISEHLPKLAKWTDKMAIIRSMTSKEGDHGRAAHLMHTGYLPSNAVAYPTLGSFVVKDRGLAAQFREHRAVPLLQPGCLCLGLPGADVCAAHHRRQPGQRLCARQPVRRGAEG
jgi:hypothetical protein